MKVISPGVYQNNHGFWIRPVVNGRRIKKKLHAITRTMAIREAEAFRVDLGRSEAGLGPSPIPRKEGLFSHLAQLYAAAGCPNARLERRGPEFCASEAGRLKFLIEHFGQMESDKINLMSLLPYKDWRMAQCKHGPGHRVVEMDWVTLSNVLTYGVRLNLVEVNRVRSLRPRLRIDNPGKSSTAVRIRKSREVMPADGDAVTSIANYFFELEPITEVLGWLFLWACATGCRRSELLRMRLDAKNPEEPGFIRGDYVYARRSKGGYNPFIKLEPSTRAMLDCFLFWHQMRFPCNPWFFPGRPASNDSLPTQSCLDKDSLGHGLRRACQVLGHPHITPHGCRAYYVTKRRREGASDAIVAAEIGDRTISMISQNYGDLPGGEPLSLFPKEGLAAWLRWRPEEQKIESIA